MQTNVSGLLRDFARVRRAALAGERVVVTTRDGNLVLTAEPRTADSGPGSLQDRTSNPDEDLPAVAASAPAVTLGAGGRSEPGSRPTGARRFVSRAAIAGAARSAPRIDAQRFRADLDAIVDSEIDG